MKYTDTLITDYSHPGFQGAFRAYFGELGVTIRDWDGLFAEMAASAEPACLRQDDAGRVVGFILFAEMDMTGWFFTAKAGFIRELWVEEGLRQQGHGAALLALAEAELRRRGCAFALLTTDTAPAFYMKRGWTRAAGIQAKNKDDAYVKLL